MAVFVNLRGLMSIKNLAVAALLFALPVSASATDWYIFDVGQLKCLNAQRVAQEHDQPEFANPYAFRRAARRLSSYGGTRVFHYANGQMAVLISAMHREMYFLSSLQTCRIVKQVYVSTGHDVNNLNELK